MQILRDSERAKRVATTLHENQRYGELQPYTDHLEEVVEMTLMLSQGYPHEKQLVLVNAGWLHDTLEDTNASYSSIKKLFGEQVAEIVYAVTDELGRNRKERTEKTWPKIKGFHDATLVKLADRIANMQAGIRTKNVSKLSMYIKEFKDFEDALRVKGHNETGWEILEDTFKDSLLVVKVAKGG